MVPSDCDLNPIPQDIHCSNPQVEMDAAFARRLATEEVLGSGAPSEGVDTSASQRTTWEAFAVDLGHSVFVGGSSSQSSVALLGNNLLGGGPRRASGHVPMGVLAIVS
ncbi:hypothetical protein SEVIR_9G251938v4 [Setaria viridis]